MEMEITRSLTEKIFVMFLDRELDLQQRIGKPDLDHAVSTAECCTVSTVLKMKEHGHEERKAS